MDILIDTDVAIVGCGPVGAVAANLLGLQGLRVMVLERERIGHAQPRAFSCDDEALRVYQAAGLVDEVRAHMARASVVHYTGVEGASSPRSTSRGWTSATAFRRSTSSTSPPWRRSCAAGWTASTT